MLARFLILGRASGSHLFLLNPGPLGEVASLNCQVYDAWCAFLGCRFHRDKTFPSGGYWLAYTEIWSETISGGEEILARKWGGLFWATSLEKIFSGVIAIVSYRPGGRMQQSAVPRCAILSVGSTGGIGQ